MLGPTLLWYYFENKIIYYIEQVRKTQWISAFIFYK